MMGPVLYGAAARLSGPVLRAHLRRRAKHGKEDPRRLTERFGCATVMRPDAPLVWFHAASVGESLSLLPLLNALTDREPALHILVTTGTRSSADLLRERLPHQALHQYVPLDHPAWVARFLDHWRPEVALFVESELWPNLLRQTQRRGVPTGLLNARMSDRSFARWQRWPGLIRPLMGGLSLCLAQSPAQAERMAALGAPDAWSPGNLKAAAPPAQPDPAARAHLAAAIGERPHWLAASTHPGEEAITADAHAALVERVPNLLTLIVPRHPQRGEAIARKLRQRGINVARRSQNDKLTSETGIYLADSLGELPLFYSLSDIAFIGGSLTLHGGHNPIEAAHYSCAILHGPDMANVADIATALADEGAATTVTDAGDLANAVETRLAEPGLCAQDGANAQAFAAAQTHVLPAVLDALAPLLAPLRATDAAA